MEGGFRFRFAVITFIALGSIYFILPSFAPNDAAATATEGAVKVFKEKPLEVWYKADDGEADEATALALQARFEGAGVGIERVVTEGTKLVIYEQIGTSKDIVQAVVSQKGERSLVQADALGENASAQPVDADASVRFTSFDLANDAGAPHLKLSEGWPQDVQSLGIVVDGWVVGLAHAPEEGAETSAVAWLPDASQAAIGAAFTGPLPESLSRWSFQVLADHKADDDAAEQTSWLPPAILPYLPPTRINLGLDLQGGIDLTLQVDQDAAVAVSLHRDTRLLSDAIAKSDLDISVERERARPAITLTSKESFKAISNFVGEHLTDYHYLESYNDADGVGHYTWIMNDEVAQTIRDQAVEQNLETLRRRVDATGVKEPSIVKMDGGRINVQLPGVQDAEQAIAAIGTQATLTFRLVDEKANMPQVQAALTKAQTELPPEQFDDNDILNEWLHAQGLIAADRVVRWEIRDTDAASAQDKTPMLLMDDVPLTGSDLSDARVGWDHTNLPQVLMSFKAHGATVFCDLTTANVNHRFAILLDDVIRSAPNINEPICGGSASISIGSSVDAMEQANTLALVLRSGALSAPVHVGAASKIGATIGAEAIRSGTTGAIIGSLLSMTFMIVWYGLGGVAANIALTINVLLVFALLALMGATLTLPGIAGIALSVGMAFDANIIIYERIREELAIGTNARKAVEAGYDKGLTPVLDANITTAIVGVVLYSYGTGPIRGFAVTLLIGIVTTLLTALYVTQSIMEWLTRSSDSRLRL